MDGPARPEDNETRDEAEAPMNIESIPQYDQPAITPPEDATSASSSPDLSVDVESNATSSSSETPAPKPLPMGKKARKRLARKESGKNNVTEEVKEMDPSKDEDMSALSWLQVQCGYGGDLNGPGR